ncbi:Non-repetitive/WGA-negative nucleoporin C-terminal domain containing protein [Rhypophila sp. PSN 637]
MNAVTPMRQIPGAFLNTPAPQGANTVQRRLNFGETTGSTATSRLGNMTGSRALVGGNAADLTAVNPVPAPVQREELPPVVKAAQCVNQTLQQDESYPDLDSYCRLGGSSDHDLQPAGSSWAPFQRGSSFAIPDQVFNLLNNGEVHTRLGLFASINYAWASIDSSLFLWDYTHPNPELIGYEEAAHTITAVALVPPKPDVFVKSITHILVVATTSEVILLGLAASPTPAGTKTVSLYQTKMSVHRGSSDVSLIVGTASGRIFLGGDSDTDIYELFYQQEERWFSSRCYKVNHTHPGWTSVVPSLPAPNIFGSRSHEYLLKIVVDDTRNLVYSLSSQSTIRTYHMESADKLTKVIEKDKVSCLRDITHMLELRQGGSNLLNDRISIVSLSPISSTEASKLHLMALTNTGCRLFLSATSSASYMVGASNSLAPQSMQVQFVKFPPKEQTARAGSSAAARDAGYDYTSTALNPSAFGYRFAPGFFFDVVRKNPGTGEDNLFVSAPDTGRIKITSPASALKYYEQGTWIEFDRNCVVLDIGMTTSPFKAGSQPLGFGNELAVQFDQVPGEFAVLTNTGVHVVRRRRLVDIFAAAIRSASGDEGLEKEMRKFISQYGRVESVSAALAVACGQGSELRTGTSRAVDQATEDKARNAFVDFGGQPTVAETDGNTITAESVRLSSRHDALALYLTRLIRKLWKAKVVEVKTDKASGGLTVKSTIPSAKLTSVQENIERLRNFLEANKSLIQGLAGPSDRLSSRQDEIALQKEHQALHSLRKLMTSISEGISFVQMLFDERVSDIFTRLDATAQEQLRNLTYESLFSQEPGKELAKVLVKAIVNRNIASGSNVETVADALRRRCGSFCSPDDVVIFKAQEQLQRASEHAKTPNVLRTLLAESLRLFEQVAGSLTMANLQGAVEQYIELKYYAGAIQLCLTVAREKDRGNTALTWVNDGKPANDPRQKAFDARKACYALIHNVLDHLETSFGAEPEMVDGRPTLAATKRMEAYSVVNDSDDEVFHFDLYDWYIEKKWTERILNVDSPHVITYLRRLAATDARHADLLCRFYTHRSRFFEAAQVQLDLAKSEFAFGIKERITLLSRAKANASVPTTGVSRQEQQLLLHEATELLDVAHIQDDLLEKLRVDSRIPDEKMPEIEEKLNGPIQGLSELFNDFADQAGYHELSLLIYHAADFQNPRVIAETWEQLINDVHFENEQKREAWRLHRRRQPIPAGVEVPLSEPPMPYESVSTSIQTIAHRTSLDSLIFPVDTLLPLVCSYAVNNSQDASIGADPSWPVVLFLQLGVPHSLVIRVLESVFDTHEAPFTGRRRKNVVQWIDTAVESWVREVERRGGGAALATKGEESSLTGWVRELLGRADEALTQIANSGSVRAGTPEAEELMAIRRINAALRRQVDVIAQQAENNLGASLFTGR